LLTLAAALWGGMHAPASAQESKALPVVVAFAYKDSFDAYIVPKMKELYKVDVQVSAFLSAEALARAISQKANPQIAVFMLDEGPWQQGSATGLWDKLDPAIMTNLADVPAKYRSLSGDGVAVMTTLLGFLYDKGGLDANNVAPPQSLNDLWKPEFKNRLAVPQFSSTYAFGFLDIVNKVEKGNPKTFDKGFARLKELRTNIRTFPGPAAQMIQLLQQKEILVGWGPYFVAAQARKSGVPVSWVPASEGAVSVPNYAAVPRGVVDKQNAMRLINLVIAPEFQKMMAQRNGLAPINPKTDLSADATSDAPSSAVIQAAMLPSWEVYNAERIRLNERWQREIAN